MTLLIEPHDNPWRRSEPAPHPAALCWLLEEAAAVAYGVPPDELRAGSRRGAQVAFARQSAMYLAHVVLGLNYREVGALFRRDRTTAAYACRRARTAATIPRSISGSTCWRASAPKSSSGCSPRRPRHERPRPQGGAPARATGA